MKEKNKKELRKKRESIFIILNLLVSILAIAFMMGLESEGVSGAVIPKPQSALDELDKAIKDLKQPKSPATIVARTEVDLKPLTPIKESGQLSTTTISGIETKVATDVAATHAIINGKYYELDSLGRVVGEIDKASLPAGANVVQGTSTTQGPVPLGTQVTSETATKGYGKLAKILGIKNPVMGNLVQGIQWSAVAYFAIPFIGDLLGLEPETTKALQYAVSSGLFAYNAAEAVQASSLLGKSTGFFASSSFPAIAGIGVGIAVFILTYEKVEYKTVSFECLPWEAPVGGNDCEKCNDEIQTCSRYRCKSLGQACELVNEGTDKELCYWANPKDVASPMITPLEDVLTDGYEYTNTKPRPPSWGTTIVKTRSKDGCIAAFTPISFGIQTNKPSQCKIDFNRTTMYDEMPFYFGESNLYDYNHTQRMNLPSPDAINSFAKTTENETGGLTIQNDGRYTLYARCRSGNGFWNIDAYEIKFCVDKGPDTTPPQIIETSIRNNQPVQFEIDKVPIVVYTNEPASCRWSRTDQNFNKMENNMSCASNPMQMQSNLLYACSGELTNIEDRKDNNFYFRCEDQPWKPKNERIPMTQSYQFTLKGTQPLNIIEDSVSPSNETVEGATTTVNVTLYLETEHGYKDGEATCYYNSGNEDNYVEFLETNSYKHVQRQDLTAGTYTYYLKCVDLGGNQDTTSTTFAVFIDTKEPSVVRVLFDEDKLKIQTDEDADCYYSTNTNTQCNYELTNEGINLMPHETNDNKKEHFAPWNLKETYYIKCKDVNGKQPSPTQCSITVRPTEISII